MRLENCRSTDRQALFEIYDTMAAHVGENHKVSSASSVVTFCSSLTSVFEPLVNLTYRVRWKDFTADYQLTQWCLHYLIERAPWYTGRLNILWTLWVTCCQGTGLWQIMRCLESGNLQSRTALDETFEKFTNFKCHGGQDLERHSQSFNFVLGRWIGFSWQESDRGDVTISKSLTVDNENGVTWIWESTAHWKMLDVLWQKRNPEKLLQKM